MTDTAVSGGGYDELAECGAAAGAITAHRTPHVLHPASCVQPLSSICFGTAASLQTSQNYTNILNLL